MENKGLKVIGFVALGLTLLIIIYTVINALAWDKPQPINSSNNASENLSSLPPGHPPIDKQTNASNISSSKALFPSELDGLTRVDLISGQDAIAQVSQLHGKDISVNEAYVAHYKNQASGQLTIWYSLSNNEQEATALFTAMDKLMPNSNVFQNFKTVSIEGRNYQFVNGMGLNHYYWQSGSQILWVAMNGLDDVQVLKVLGKLY